MRFGGMAEQKNQGKVHQSKRAVVAGVASHDVARDSPAPTRLSLFEMLASRARIRFAEYDHDSWKNHECTSGRSTSAPEETNTMKKIIHASLDNQSAFREVAHPSIEL